MSQGTLECANIKESLENALYFARQDKKEKDGLKGILKYYELLRGSGEAPFSSLVKAVEDEKNNMSKRKIQDTMFSLYLSKSKRKHGAKRRFLTKNYFHIRELRSDLNYSPYRISNYLKLKTGRYISPRYIYDFVKATIDVPPKTNQEKKEEKCLTDKQKKMIENKILRGKIMVEKNTYLYVNYKELKKKKDDYCLTYPELVYYIKESRNYSFCQTNLSKVFSKMEKYYRVLEEENNKEEEK